MEFKELTESDGWKKFEIKLEKLGALVLLVGLIVHLLNVNPNRPNYLLVVGLSTLTIVYFFCGFKELKSTDYVSSIFFRIYGWGLAITSVSLMFTLMQWPIHKNSLLISIGLLAVSLILALKFRNEENKQQINYIFFIRIGVALVLAGVVYYTKVMGAY
ncbi:MAG TPA: hypothetical protein PK252_00230 [Bacteroidales bacterium]|nr:hypothetical protein [Bacteroidales bacterium]